MFSQRGIVMRKPYFKKSHQAWYCNHNGKPVRLGKTEQEAMIAWAAIYKASDFTLADLVKRWLAFVEKNKSKETHASYRRYANKWADLHGKQAAASIRGHHVSEFVERVFPPTDYSDSVRWQAQKVAVVMYAWAKDQGLVEINHLADYRKSARCGKRDSYLTLDQYKVLIKACQDSDFCDLLTVFWETGARPFEVFQAEARHLDRENRCLRFFKRKGDKVKSKEQNAIRTLWLSEKAFEIVSRLADRYPEGPLFRNNLGRKWTITGCSRRLSSLFRKTKVKTTLYDFRHGFAHYHATVLGTNIVTLAALMGHSSIKMLAEIYAHVGANAEFMLAAVNGTAGNGRKKRAS
jgi:integrase